MAIHENVFILPAREQVVFPVVRANIKIPSDTYAKMCELGGNDNHVGVVTVKPSSTGKELYRVGTYCRRTVFAETNSEKNGQQVTHITLALEGVARFKVLEWTTTTERHFAAKIRLHEERRVPEPSPEVQALVESLQHKVVELNREHQTGANKSGGAVVGANPRAVRWPSSPSVLADFVTVGLRQLSVAERQQVLETFDIKERLELVLSLATKAVAVLRLSKELNSKVAKRSEEELRETVLRRQLGELKREIRKLKPKGKGGAAEGDRADDADEPEPEEEENDDEDEVTALRDALRKAKLSPEAHKAAQRELRRLQNIQPQHPEYTVCRTYLEILSQLPWAESSRDDLDLNQAFEILERDHYGLEKVKKRILEFLAVQKMRGDMKGPILCLHGPPGVGKTSLGRSVAKALGRKFHRIALGGVRDEAELRGHRRTYIGSMPGAIIQALIALKVNNPVILLDEIDKLTRNATFNPSGAMLELLDPEQNNTFKDHYVNTPFDLSKVLFLCTANDLHTIDRPLLDRMEVIDLSGYTVEEKVHIATTHLLPKQRRVHALERDPEEGDKPITAADVAFNEEGAEQIQPPAPLLEITRDAIMDLVTKWTRESGVRSLERRLAQVCRWAALRLAGTGVVGTGESAGDAERIAEAALAECGPDASGRLRVDAPHLRHIVGAELFESDLAERLGVGVAMGLGVTPTGGQLLFVEATRSKGSGKLTITGQLGEVMRESVSTAMSMLRSKIYYAALAATGKAHPARRVDSPPDVLPQAQVWYSIEQRKEAGLALSFQDVFHPLIARGEPLKDPFGNDDIHVHFPAGAIPKDGPSAGVTTTLALASLLLNRPVRSDTAMTGEITLRGHVLPVGGIRDKVLAAHRAGVRHVLLPFANQRHVKDDIPACALDEIELHFIKNIDEALAWVFGDSSKESAELATGAPSAALDSAGPAAAAEVRLANAAPLLRARL